MFDTNPSAWVVPDRALFAAARDTGFVCIAGLPTDIPLEPTTRARLLSIFGRGAAEKYSLCRRKFAPENRNIYRGWFPLQPGNLTSKEGIDIGADVAHGSSVTMAGDPLREPSPLPENDRLPAHTDSGFVTLLAQDAVSGLQARSLDGRWIDVPPLEGTMVVNFGQVLEQWSAGRIRATEHRVLGKGVERYSIPFFYEARADATIAPLPIDPPDRFVPFEYGDFLWKRMTSFVEFRGMEHERDSFRQRFLNYGCRLWRPLIRHKLSRIVHLRRLAGCDAVAADLNEL